MVPYQCLAFFPISSFLILFTVIREASAIGCFVCSSVNGSEPLCEDTFSNAGSSSFYKQNCLAGRKGRTGWFPATACVKLKAELDGYRVVVRQCVVDDGGTNSETEIGRETHCGMVDMVKFDNKYMKGCSLACLTDGCNAGNDVTAARYVVIGSLLAAMIAVLRWDYAVGQLLERLNL